MGIEIGKCETCQRMMLPKGTPSKDQDSQAPIEPLEANTQECIEYIEVACFKTKVKYIFNIKSS